MRLFSIFFFCAALVLPASSVSGKEFIWVHACRHAGMGYVLLHVFNLLAQYDLGKIHGLKVDFGKTGCYYDAEHGNNWWEYYFEPVSIGVAKKVDIKHIYTDLEMRKQNKNSKDSRTIIGKAVQKYVQVKPEIERAVDLFVSHNYRGYFIVGVHYRGTDKRTETPRVPYERMMRSVEQKIYSLESEGKEVKLFVATDEQNFLDHMIQLFPDKVLYNEAVIRNPDNTSPLHLMHPGSPYETGRNALIDCLLLSKVDFLLKTVSNLSDCSLRFNPHLPFELVSP